MGVWHEAVRVCYGGCHADCGAGNNRFPLAGGTKSYRSSAFLCTFPRPGLTWEDADNSVTGAFRPPSGR